MSKRIYPSWLPRLSTPVVRDAADDLRALRGDYDGGAFAGACGSFHAIWREAVTDTSTGAGVFRALTTAVAAGYLGIAQLVLVRHNAAAALDTYMTLLSGGVYYDLHNNYTLGQMVPLRLETPLVLEAGEQLVGTIVATAINQPVYLKVCGYWVQL